MPSPSAVNANLALVPVIGREDDLFLSPLRRRRRAVVRGEWASVAAASSPPPVW